MRPSTRFAAVVPILVLCSLRAFAQAGPFTVSATTGECKPGDTYPTPAAVSLTWTPSAGATSYTIFRNRNSIATVPATTTAYVDRVGAGTFEYIVAARDNTPAPPTAAYVLVSPPMCTPLPGRFTASASAFCVGGQSPAPAVHVTWSASANASGYVVRRNGDYVSGGLAASTTSFDDTNVVVGRSYGYEVIASNKLGFTEWATTSEVVISDATCATPPPAPDLVPSETTLSTVSVLPGERVDVTFTVLNAGTQIAAASTTRIRLGNDRSNATAFATVVTPSLAPGTSARLSAGSFVPAVAPGTYFLFITVDDDHTMPQLSTANDTLQSPPIAVRSRVAPAVPPRRRASGH